VQAAHQLRVSTNSAYQWRRLWRALLITEIACHSGHKLVTRNLSRSLADTPFRGSGRVEALTAQVPKPTGGQAYSTAGTFYPAQFAPMQGRQIQPMAVVSSTATSIGRYPAAVVQCRTTSSRNHDEAITASTWRTTERTE
jgi:hypothetical protein